MKGTKKTSAVTQKLCPVFLEWRVGCYMDKNEIITSPSVLDVTRGNLASHGVNSLWGTNTSSCATLTLSTRCCASSNNGCSSLLIKLSFLPRSSHLWVLFPRVEDFVTVTDLMQIWLCVLCVHLIFNIFHLKKRGSITSTFSTVLNTFVFMAWIIGQYFSYFSTLYHIL